MDSPAVFIGAVLPTRLQSWIEAFGEAHRLSARELGVVMVMVMGYTTKRAPDVLGCSANTAATYWKRVFRKTQSTSKCEVLLRILAFASEGEAPEPRYAERLAG